MWQQGLLGIQEVSRISLIMNCIWPFELQYLLAGIGNFFLSVVL
jgi:hypothetical protein